MKTCATFLLLFFLGLKLGVCQNQNRLAIPIVNENAIVDSAVNFISSGEAVPIMHGRPANYHWLSFSIQTNHHGGYSFSAFKMSENSINLLVNRMISAKTGFGYFKYKGYLIFVEQEEEFNSFYKILSKSTSFDFLHKLKRLEPTMEIKREDDEFWMYNYSNGRFWLDTPPTIR